MAQRDPRPGDKGSQSAGHEPRDTGGLYGRLLLYSFFSPSPTSNCIMKVRAPQHQFDRHPNRKDQGRKKIFFCCFGSKAWERVKKAMEVIFEDRSLLGAVRGGRGTQRETEVLLLSAPTNICSDGWRWIDPEWRRPWMQRTTTLLEEC